MKKLLSLIFLLAFTIPAAARYQGDYFIFSKGDKQLVLDSKGGIFIPLKYSFIKHINKKLWVAGVKIDAKAAVKDPNDDPFLDSGPAYRIVYLDGRGRELPDGWFEKNRDFSEGLAEVRRNGKWGFIDDSGNVKIGFTFDKTERFIRGLAAVNINGKWGYINKNGKIVIPAEYDDNGGKFFLSDYNVMKKGDKAYILDKQGKQVIVLEKGMIVDNNNDFISGHYLRLEKGGKFSVSDLRKGKLEDFKYDYTDYGFGDGLLRFSINGKFGFLDENLNIKIAPKYEQVLDFHEGLAKIKINGKWGYMNKNENIVIKPQFEDIRDKGFLKYSMFEGGLAIGSINGKMGAINKKGEFVLKPDYSYIDISNMANIIYLYDREKHETGLANKQGKIILEVGKYHVICCIYVNNRIPVSTYKKNRNEPDDVFADDKSIKSGYVDFNGKVLIKPVYDAAYFYRNGLAAVKMNDKWGFIDNNERLVIDYRFDAVALDGFNDKGAVAVKVNGKWGIIDKKGNYIAEPVYDDDNMNQYTWTSDYDSRDHDSFINWSGL